MKTICDPLGDLDNHQNRCRLCLGAVEDAANKIKIEDEARLMISELNIQLICTSPYSSFICSECHMNLIHLSTFRNEVLEKQRQLSKFLCRIKDESNDEDGSSAEWLADSIKPEPDYEPVNFEPVVIKIEYDINNDNTETLPVNNFEDSSLLVVGPLEDSKSNVSSLEVCCDIKDNKVSKQLKKTKTNEKNGKNDFAPCALCGKMLKKYSILNHVRQVHNKKTNFFCDYCGKGMFRKFHLEEHVRYHVPKEFRIKNHKCSQCPKTFMTKQLRLKHFQNIHSCESWECDCGKIFKSCFLLKQHKLMNHNKEMFKKTCVHCGKVLCNADSLKNHVLSFHTEGPGKFMCSECGRQFMSKAVLKDHMRSHMEKTLPCDEPGCSLKFVYHFQLNKHKRVTHLKIKHFKCHYEGCGKSSSSSQKLLRHVKLTHEKHRQKCPVIDCKFKVGRRDLMANHLKKHFELQSEVQSCMIESLKNLEFY